MAIYKTKKKKRQTRVLQLIKQILWEMSGHVFEARSDNSHHLV